MRLLKYLLFGLFFISFNTFALTLTVPEYFLNNHLQEWQLIETEITNTSDKTVVLIWAGGGGLVSMGIDFINVLIRAENHGKTIIFDLQPGEIWSMHADVACYASQLKFEEGAVLVFHPIADENGLVRDPDSIDAATQMLQPCIMKGILSKEDVQKSLYYMEVYVSICKGTANTYCRTYSIDRRL